ncbi:hypothetical protein GHT06_002335 [Daphnia sinensis]|uniref:Cc8L18.2-like protein n=1 Tax=Daphnia sinensis TaxID=1820382 RepID=A0AAD5KFZ5_9CRUS|nr:hypothetical protein GHT06_002335 [Daphnia sinensis]
MDAVRNKISTSKDRKERYSLLTLAPHSWSVPQVATYFDVTLHAAKMSAALTVESGILPEIKGPKVRGRIITEDDIQRMVDFYTSDEYTRQLPGIKNVKSIKQGNKRVKVQKRLLLMNLNELYAEYKKQSTVLGYQTFGFSVFASKRPANVVTVGSSGTHSRHCFMDKIVCSVSNKTCMVDRCSSCPGEAALHEFLIELTTEEDDDISYKKWTQTDGTKLETITEDKEEFIESLVKMISKLTKHHYVARCQSAHFALCKSEVQPDSCVLVSDFSENFAFVIQDCIQGYYWMNDHATLLPFMGIMRKEDGSKIIYWTDGAASQYKNKKNFANLCCHEVDFGLSAEWHFFASCHGKSACDGIGGTLKRLARLASLQRHSANQITTPQELFHWATENVDFKTFYVSSDEVMTNQDVIQQRMDEAIPVRGTRGYHCYIPLNLYQISASSLSGLESEFNIYDVLPNNDVFQFESCSVNDYIACIYEENGLWYVAQISQIDQVNQEYVVNFLSPDGESGFHKGFKLTSKSASVGPQSVLLKMSSI